ncbi:hypothetical protein GCM10022288_21330 [Gryllotalpicola kribbensis]|jgi:hypothetical protein|uniref:Uncharacterized protein n=1 Tax=Gryllotalpicola kribbensis TaxID=993084 RepID=A0ABP8AUY7_9MICO
MIFGTKKPRPIADFDMGLVDGWQWVDTEDARWPDQLAADLGLTGAERQNLSGQLGAVAARVKEIGADRDGAGSLVWIPPQDQARVRCVLSFRLTNPYEGGPGAYEGYLAADEGRREPGRRYDIVQTWRGTAPIGDVVGAYNVITYTDLLEDAPRSEARTLFGVFPTGASQMFEFVFTSDDLDGFTDMVERTSEWVATLTVELEK